MADSADDRVRSMSDTRLPYSHSCRHCEVPLQVHSPEARPHGLLRLPLPYTVRQVFKASQTGCPLCKELVSVYKQRSWWLLLKTHLLCRCSCCNSTKQRFYYLLKSVGQKPFSLVFFPLPYGPKTINSHAYFDSGNGFTGTRFNAYTYTGDDAAAILPSFSLEVDSAETTHGIEQWISSCNCGPGIHDTDRSPFRPTRLIDVGERSNCDSVTVMPTLGRNIPAYVCLSYCWGGPQTLVCTSSNFNPSQGWTVPLAAIPAGLVDSFKVTRKIGFRYIWIDSLCIIQDDPNDLENEILQMPNIYKNAALTICASVSHSSREGFLHPRADYSGMKIPLGLPRGRAGTAYLDSFLCWDPPVPEPLSERAWAFQERLLSPRLLEYGWRTARWTCSCTNGYSGRTVLSSNGIVNATSEADMQPRAYSLFMYLNPAGIRNLPSSRTDIFVSWTGIVWRYSALKLTFPEDRLAAIGAVAAELQRITGVRYLAGLWHHERLASFLQWRVMSPLGDLCQRPGQARTPSWSWAGLDNKVWFWHSEGIVDTFEVLSADATGGFGRTATGFVTVKGPLRRGVWWRGDENVRMEVSQVGFEIQDGHGPALTISPDCAEELVGFVDGYPTLLMKGLELVLLAIGRSNVDCDEVRGLILARKDASKALYTRVGIFDVRDEGYFSVRDWSTETITIV